MSIADDRVGPHGLKYGAPNAGAYGQAPMYAPASNPAYNPHYQYAGHNQAQYGAAPPYNIPQGYQPHGMAYGGPPAPPGSSPELWNWFQAVDRDRSGSITAVELKMALMNNNWTHFNDETCRIMVGMFDRDRNGTINFQEFGALWKYIQDWKRCFDGFDTDRSGNIDANELGNAFKTFGYNLSMNFCNLCIRVFDRLYQRSIKFDDFIQCCVMLKTLTDKFREKDVNQSGMINIHYEQFLEMALDNTLL